MKVQLSKLIEQLPRIGASSDPDEQIKAVLHPLVERALGIHLPGTKVPRNPLRCPNCDRPTDSTRSPYCSNECREKSSFVRQFRNVITEGLIFDPERQAGMGQALWSLQGGGYPRRQMMVPKRVLAKVIEREGGICSICGAPATEIDHTGSG